MWINTAELDEAAIAALSPHDAHQVYNGLDTTTTFEINEVLSEQLRQINHPGPAAAYSFKMAMLGPATDMTRRGIRIDVPKRNELVERLFARRLVLEARLNEITQAICDRDVNARSPVALQPIFYDVLGIQPIVKRVKGESKTPMDMEVLENLRDFTLARPIANLVIDIRGLGKQIGVLRTGIDADNRMRAAYNVAGPETERWSSSENPMGTGTNFQNITDELREIFIADPGHKFAYVDLSQAESFVVGLAVYRATGDDTYLRACESGDLHTGVCKLAWTDRAWPDDPKAARALADEPFYRHFSFRDISKRLGHASNLLGRPFGLAKKLRMEQRLIQEFQNSYLRGFKIDKYHADVIRRLQVDGELTTILGNRRQFFGRAYDEATWREAVAYEPQSVIAILLNSGMYRTWKAQQSGRPYYLSAQVHDAILIQYPESLESEVIPEVQDHLSIPLQATHNGTARTTLVPSEAAVGWNWAKKTSKNPDGLEKWNGHDTRKRTGNPEATLMDRRVP